ncbi:MAG: prepilin-type N-terminal cleavage/methylation domain-containing protein [Patescibacteria group bacterium]|nr:prepilin-type N-terminal cleavage/methylation domain-containing protein [Patescibacteria group bacterium]
MYRKCKIPNTKYQILNTNEGFTLLELLISLSIITMMIALFLANYNAGIRSNELSIAAQQIVSDTHSAQNKALGSTIYNTKFPDGGWGVHFDTSAGSYKVFADSNGDKIYNSSPDDEALVAYGGQTFSLPANVIISSIVTKNGNQSALDVTFLPPDPITRIYDGIGTSTVATTTLKNLITNKTTTITINVLGLVQAN